MYQWTGGESTDDLSGGTNDEMTSWSFMRNPTAVSRGSIANEPVGDELIEHRLHDMNPIRFGKKVMARCTNGIQRGSRMLVDEYYGYYSQYTRDRIGAISVDLIGRSIRQFTSK